MNERTTNITLVCTDTRSALVDWSRATLDDSRVVTAWSPDLCEEAIRLAQGEMNVDLKRVVFDQTADVEKFVEIVAWLGAEFRGDIVLLKSAEEGFLSAAGTREGRVMYKMDESDIQFYLEAFGMSQQPRTQLRLVG